MPGKRKRVRPGHGIHDQSKRQRISGGLNVNGNVIVIENNHSQRDRTRKEPLVKHAVLAQYYPKIFTLREYLLSKLPTTSRFRRKKIISVGQKLPREEEPNSVNEDASLSKFLDQTLVGVLKCEGVSQQQRLTQWMSFSQKIDISTSTVGNTSNAGLFSQSEIVDFCIWLLFTQANPFKGRVQHILCQGYRRDVSSRSVHGDTKLTSAIPGVISTYPNSNTVSMKASPWIQILALMGKEGERLMIDLILDCGIFVAIESGHGSYYQLSGQPLGDLRIHPNPTAQNSCLGGSKPQDCSTKATAEIAEKRLHSPGSITFVRNRMMYARAALNAQGGVRFGLRHIHALNRYPYQHQAGIVSSKETTPGSATKIDGGPHHNTLRVMMYIFPRQFGLHNVFTSMVDTRQTVQPFKDYTLREDEISQKFKSGKIKVPKRLRGATVALVEKLQILHGRCPYNKLLEYYCPILKSTSRPEGSEQQSQKASSYASTAMQTQNSIISAKSPDLIMPGTVKIPEQKSSMMDHATSPSMVSAFCRAVLRQLIPRGFWGEGEVQTHNERIFYRNVDKFIKIRRFESLTLHQILQELKITDLPWLIPPGSTQAKTSQSDTTKRLEIFHEFVYYLFDSILIPLIRANFHVTESNIHRYRLFYFRHDVWRSLAEPALASLKVSMFQELKPEEAKNIMDGRSLGFSLVRLLPKETGVRPIMNLRRRSLKKGANNMLGNSINSILGPVYNVFTFEKTLDPHLLGSSLFSVGDLYQKLKSFKSKLGGSSKQLYFAKVDVRAAFDTIPQKAVLKLMSSVPSESEYRISKHVEIKPGEGDRLNTISQAGSKPIRRWTSMAKASDDFQTFDEKLEAELAIGKKNTIFVENVVQQYFQKDELLSLLAEHIRCNLVKIGKKFYRQREGIPQGSVMSSLLCNYFYANLEMNHLAFLQSGESLLLRLIDDFLLITTDRQHAKSFLQVMHDGLPAYGVTVNPAKTLTNFEAVINGTKVSRLVGDRNFPYCGNFINTGTLNVSKDRERRKDMAISDSLTIEFSKLPGKTFNRKILASFKIQAHAMHLDTNLNSLTTVLSNIYAAFTETATKMWTYSRSLPISAQLKIKTISDLMELAFVLMKGKGKNVRNTGYKCAVTKMQVEWLAAQAFCRVLRRRQSGHGEVLRWLEGKIQGLRGKNREVCERMKGLLVFAEAGND